MYCFLVLLLLPLFQACLGYNLTKNYQGKSFLTDFTYFSGPDYVGGFVDYQSKENATSKHLAYVEKNRFIMKADNTSITPNGRPSVRIQSIDTYDHGLFILDLNHMPYGCGTWPAYWYSGQNYPHGGEIDIIEGVNLQKLNYINLYSAYTCTMNNTNRVMSGTPSSNLKCDLSSDTGCSTQHNDTSGYGADLNKNGGGVYVLRWEQETGIQIWFFSRSLIPKDITSGNPAPHTWGIPIADYPFNDHCKSNNFSKLRIIINLTFCGSWAGTKSNYKGYGCPSSCESFVANNPKAFSEAYWDINSLKIYQQ